MVHTAVAFSKMNNRLRTFACASSIGLGATTLVTGVATGTLNHIPVLLLQGDTFAGRNVAPDARHFRRLAIEQNQKLGHGFCAANAFFALMLLSFLLKQRLVACQSG
jgi:TPP-dependent trihydroxycyclohexane-1,2-dione (THcHDO) dehydratase